MGVVGPKYYNITGIWALNPYYLGPWTLRDSQLKVSESPRTFGSIDPA